MKTNTLTLEAKNITKSFGQTQVLKGISLNVARGEMLGILGDNGAGAGLIQVTNGDFYGKRRKEEPTAQVLLTRSHLVDTSVRCIASVLRPIVRTAHVPKRA